MQRKLLILALISAYVSAFAGTDGSTGTDGSIRKDKCRKVRIELCPKRIRPLSDLEEISAYYGTSRISGA